MTELTFALLNGLLMGLFALSVAALATGVWIFFAPPKLLQAVERSNRRFDVAAWFAPANTPRKIDRVLFRHHRFVGIVLVLGSVYILTSLMFQSDLSAGVQSQLSRWLLQGAVILLGLGAIFGLVVGAIVTIRPSLLRGLESWANSWVSTERAEHWLDDEHTNLDLVLQTHHRITGILIIIGSLYAVIGLASVLFSGQ